MTFVQIQTDQDRKALINVEEIAAVMSDDADETTFIVLTSGHRVYCRDGFDEVSALVAGLWRNLK